MNDPPTTHSVCLWFIEISEGPAEVERCADDRCELCRDAEPRLLEPVAA